MPVPTADYAAFLPTSRTHTVTEPESDWWAWRGNRVHLARARLPEAPVRVLVVHGVGGYSQALWPIASTVIGDKADVAAIDLPLYGDTHTPDPAAVRYEDWLDLLVDLVAAEDDGRPLILFGASLGGMLAFEVAARSRHVAAVVATCLLDPHDPAVRMRLTRFGRLGGAFVPLLALARGPIGRAMFPMRWVANFAKMSRHPGLSRLCAIDPRGGGARVPLGFLASFVGFEHTPPERNDARIVLAHPSHDEWTPVELSARILNRAAGTAQLVLLRECGHFPIEEPGLGDLTDALGELIDELTQRPRSDRSRGA